MSVLKNFLFIIFGIAIGGVVAYYYLLVSEQHTNTKNIITIIENTLTKKEVIGFLPYWLLNKAQTEYPSLTTLTYFGLTIGEDGAIVEKTSPQESEPGWYALTSGKVDPFLQATRNNHQERSLLVFSGSEASISALMEDPIPHAKNLITSVAPIMKQYNFRDLNIDIESVAVASNESQLRFQQFLREVKKRMDDNHLGTITIDVTADSFVQKRLIDPKNIIDFVDHLVIMAYDFHFQGSSVTGPVAPLLGAGVDSEYDIDTAVKVALQSIPAEKIILGVPLYGYEWETIRDATRSATIPSSGLTASTTRVASLLTDCSDCRVEKDPEAEEQYVIFPDESGSYHQIFYPDSSSTQAKIDFAKRNALGGLALWALGYEDSEIMKPLSTYK